jgi:hypothetical protein
VNLLSFLENTLHIAKKKISPEVLWLIFFAPRRSQVAMLAVRRTGKQAPMTPEKGLNRLDFVFSNELVWVSNQIGGVSNELG